MYVAKNLQSRPVLASVAEEAPEEEAVEVSDEGVTEGPISLKTTSDDQIDDEVELSGEELGALEAAGPAEKATAAKKPKKAKKVPNFDNFKKKFLIGGGIALLLLIVLLVVFGRTKATIVVRAETTPVDISLEANLNANSTTSDPETYNLKAVAQESKKTISQSFTPTGQKDLGTKAGGNMTLSIPCSAVSGSPPTIAAGTKVSSGNLNFITQGNVSLTTPSFSGGCKFTGSTTVLAENNGDQYNLSARNYSVSGYSSVSGSGSQMSGGTSKIVKVVSQDDVNKARAQIDEQDTNSIRSELKKAFGDNVTIFDDSFTTSLDNVRSEPAVGEEANEARLSGEAVYSMIGVNNNDLGAALDAFVTTKMTDPDRQRVYDNGLKSMKLEKLEATPKTAKYKITALAHYGPQFDTDKLKEDVKGKKFGEARSYLQDLPGVKGIDIKLTPFWARNLPSANRIDIKLDVDKTTSG